MKLEEDIEEDKRQNSIGAKNWKLLDDVSDCLLCFSVLPAESISMLCHCSGFCIYLLKE